MEKWRMPNLKELYLMYNNLHLIYKGGFADYNYWSSENINLYNAWDQSFKNGSQGGSDKNSKFHVRAVREYESDYVFKIGGQTDTGIVFWREGKKHKECKFQDERKKYTWNEAMDLFE